MITLALFKETITYSSSRKCNEGHLLGTTSIKRSRAGIAKVKMQIDLTKSRPTICGLVLIIMMTAHVFRILLNKRIFPPIVNTVDIKVMMEKNARS